MSKKDNFFQCSTSLSSSVRNSGLNPRQHYILAYAEYLRADPGLWRITVEYMCSCGIVGQERADEVLLRVPLRLSDKPVAERVETQLSGDILSGDIVGVLKELNATCFAHHREEVRRMVCRVGRSCFNPVG
jgi:nuclear pore complex protein Nup85